MAAKPALAGMLMLSWFGSQASAAALREPVPIDPASWISADDYPKDALTARAEGTVGMVLEIDPGGEVSDCRVTETSGSTDLDIGSCFLMRERASFEPARDDQGRPVAARIHRKITWRIPKMPPGSVSVEDAIARAASRAAVEAGKSGGPFNSYWVQMDFDVAMDGVISNCAISFDGTVEGGVLPFECPSKPVQPFTDHEGKAVARHVTKRQNVEISDKPNSPADGQPSFRPVTSPP